MLSNLEINKLIVTIKDSKEYQSLMNKTQVLNERTSKETTTRGIHIAEVAQISSRMVEKLIEAGFDKDEKGNMLNPKLAELIGLCHDLGHTPFGHDGEVALNQCLNNVEVTPEYLENRKEKFGEKYELEQKEQFEKKSFNGVRTMQFEHNEHSAEIFLKICEDNNISKDKVKDVVDGILAHSTTRVKKIPEFVEQQAVRIADKIAYINSDTADLLNEKIISLDNVPKELKGFVEISPEERVNACIDDMVEDYKENKTITGGIIEISQIKKDRAQILNIGKKSINKLENKDKILGEMLNTLPKEKQKDLIIKWKELGRKSEIVDLLKLVEPNKRDVILEKYDNTVVKDINDIEKNIKETKDILNLKYPTMSKCYVLKDMNDKVIFDRDYKGVAKTGNNVKQINKEISTLYYYYLENPLYMNENVSETFPGCSKEEKVAFYISSLENERINENYTTLIEKNEYDYEKENNKLDENMNLGIDKGEISPTNEKMLKENGEKINYEENSYLENKKTLTFDMEEIESIAKTRKMRDINHVFEEILDNTKENKVEENELEK